MNEFKKKEEKFNLLTEFAIQQLNEGQKIDRSCHYIQLNVNPTFTDKFVLQFELFEKYVNWYKTTWRMDVDRINIYNELLESELNSPTLLFEKGSIPNREFENVINKIKTCHLPIFIKIGIL